MFSLKLTCKNCPAVNVLHFDGTFSREMVEDYAGLITGSSSFFVSDPREDPISRIGKCANCGKATIYAMVTETIDVED